MTYCPGTNIEFLSKFYFIDDVLEPEKIRTYVAAACGVDLSDLGIADAESHV